MKKPAAQHTTNIHSDQTPSFITFNIGREFIDTTWRIAVPVLLFTSLGIVLDRAFGSKPWMTLLGVLVGFLFASVLIKQQLNADGANVASEEKSEKTK